MGTIWEQCSTESLDTFGFEECQRLPGAAGLASVSAVSTFARGFPRSACASGYPSRGTYTRRLTNHWLKSRNSPTPVPVYEGSSCFERVDLCQSFDSCGLGRVNEPQLVVIGKVDQGQLVVNHPARQSGWIDIRSSSDEPLGLIGVFGNRKYYTQQTFLNEKLD